MKIGEKGIVKKIISDKKNVKKRFYDMGITPDAEIEIKKIAPFGDPFQITLRGYSLMLRKDEAALLQMEVL